jgi:beta-lactamase regulating signal transducer with metallopeptidase domain
MMADGLTLLVRINLAISLAILLVMVLRAPVRGFFGPRAAYGLWLLAPVSAMACFLPSLRTIPAGSLHQPPSVWEDLFQIPAKLAQSPLAPAVWGLWLIGAALVATLFLTAQARFLRLAGQGLAGPAIVGLLDPRLVLPADFAQRFSTEEQALIRAHERAHLDRDDPRANGLLAVVQCLFWFNPLVHLASHRIRLDQEMACDALVMTRFPGARRPYAGAMLKTQLSHDRLPAGCHWGSHPLEARIRLLRAPAPSRPRQMAGAALVASLIFTCLATIWSLQSPRIEAPPSPAWPTPVMDLLIVRA